MSVEEFSFEVSGDPVENAPVMTGDSRRASVNAAESLKNWREGTKPSKPVGAGKEVMAEAQTIQDLASPSKGVKDEEVRKQEKQREEKLPQEDESEEVREESDEKISEEEDEVGEESGIEDSAEETLDEESEVEGDSDQADEPNQMESLLAKIKELEDKFVESSESQKFEAEKKEMEEIRQVVEKPFVPDFTADDVLSFVSDESREFLAEDPLALNAQVQLMNGMMQKVLEKLQERAVMESRLEDYDRNQEEVKRAQIRKQLQAENIDVEVFGSKDFQAFVGAPERNERLLELAEAFGFGTFEYAKRLHGDFVKFKAAEKAKKNTTTKKEVAQAREKVATKQAGDKARQPGKQVTQIPQGAKPVDPVARMAAWRAKQGR